MEILVYENNIAKDCETIKLINWKTFDQQIKKRAEDYVFILAPDEWDKFVELNKKLYAILKGQTNAINEAEYANQYQGIVVIVELAIQPDFVHKYKIGSFTNNILGSSHAIYFIDRSTDDLKRSNAVLKRIKDFKANISKEYNTTN